MEEIWKDIEGYEGLYEVSNLGRVRSLWNGKIKILKPWISGTGYLQITLYKDNRRENIFVHKLVCEGFIPKDSDRNTVNHKNGVKTDNNINNLEWASYSENTKHAYKNGLNKNKGESHKSAKLSKLQVQEIRNTNWKIPQREIASKFNIGTRHLRHILANKSWRDI